MTTKEKVLGALRGRTSEYVSGSQIASHLNISRNAVWKAIEQLRADGYKINAVTHKGYRLIALSDKLVPEIISRYLADLGVSRENLAPIYFYNELPCTNQKTKEHASAGAPHGTSVIARLRTGQDGLDEEITDVEADNIYMSVLIQPKRYPAFTSMQIIRLGVLSVHQALKRLLGISCQIKEVDNLYLKEKLICQIYTEGDGKLKSGKKTINSLILGISICGRGLPWNRSQVTAQILKNLLYDIPEPGIVDSAYEQLCL